VKDLSVETVARDVNYLFLRIQPFLAFETIQNNGLRSNTVCVSFLEPCTTCLCVHHLVKVWQLYV
jgi:hypothetical protein